MSAVAAAAPAAKHILHQVGCAFDAYYDRDLDEKTNTDSTSNTWSKLWAWLAYPHLRD